MRYRTIVADPPWQYDTARITTTGKQRRAEALAHYPTMPLEDICGLPVDDLAEDDSHLYLWVTCPLLFRGEPVMEAWGFQYRSFLTWEKLGTLGMGFWWRNQTEHVLFGTRGNLPIPPDKRQRNIFRAPKGRHSAKPEAFYDLVEQVSPGPYLELFARRQRLGWDTWGNEALNHVGESMGTTTRKSSVHGASGPYAKRAGSRASRENPMDRRISMGTERGLDP